MRVSILETDKVQKQRLEQNVDAKQNLGLSLKLKMEPQQYRDLLSVYSPPKTEFRRLSRERASAFGFQKALNGMNEEVRRATEE